MRHRQLVGDIGQLRAVVDGERHQKRDFAPPIGRPVDVVDRLVLAERPELAAMLEEIAHLLPGRIFRRTEQAGDGEGAAGIGPGGRRRMGFALEPAAQEARHEGVAGAEHVIDFDRKALADDAVFEIVTDRSVIDDAAHGAALEHDRRFGRRADRLQRGQHSVGARGNHDLLFGADDQVAIGQHRFHQRRDAVGLHIALETLGMAGKAPEVRAIVDVEDHLAAIGLGKTDRLALRGFGIGT